MEFAPVAQGEKVFAPSKAWLACASQNRICFEDWDQRKFSNQHCDSVCKFQVIVGPKAGPRRALGIRCSLVESTEQYIFDIFLFFARCWLLAWTAWHFAAVHQLAQCAQRKKRDWRTPRLLKKMRTFHRSGLDPLQDESHWLKRVSSKSIKGRIGRKRCPACKMLFSSRDLP